MPRSSPKVVTCSKCDGDFPKEYIRVKRVQFKEFGKGGRILRSRDVMYLCINCVQVDPDFTQPAYEALRSS